MIWRVALVSLLMLAAGENHSGYQDASPETRAMQDDDASNPGSLWVQQGEALWSQRVGAAGRSCADCHTTMRGVAVSVVFRGCARVAMSSVGALAVHPARSRTASRAWLRMRSGERVMQIPPIDGVYTRRGC